MDSIGQASSPADYLALVLGGHSSLTRQLVQILAHKQDFSVPVRDLATLVRTLANTSDAAACNRITRQWLQRNQQQVLVHWAALGFPSPANEAAGNGHAAGSVAENGAGPASQGGRRVLVFDFDQVLSRDHMMGEHMLQDAANRVFGGHERVQMLRSLFADLVKMGVTLTVCSWNSDVLIKRALCMPECDLLAYFEPGFIFGRECYDADKGVTIQSRIVEPLHLLDRPHHVLFVDDNSDNLNDARRVADVMTFHVTGSTGLSPSMCDYIRAWAK